MLNPSNLRNNQLIKERKKLVSFFLLYKSSKSNSEANISSLNVKNEKIASTI